MARAQNNIGACFAEGLGVERDPALALRWLTLAAEAGDPVGQRNLASLYFKGEGVEQDYRPRRRRSTARPPSRATRPAQDMLSWMLLEGEVMRARLRRGAALGDGRGRAGHRLGDDAARHALSQCARRARATRPRPPRWWRKAAACAAMPTARRCWARPAISAPACRAIAVAALRLAAARAAGRQRACRPFLRGGARRLDAEQHRRSRAPRRGAAAGGRAMIVGTAGHIDHGKTALVRALTGVDTDRLKEEKARGITIDLGFAYLPAPGGDVIGFVDVPGHERFVHTMLAGASGIDFVLLVVAADDGVMPQTREHLAIVDLLGIERGAGRADQGRSWRRPRGAPAVATKSAQALAGTALAEAEIIPVSTVTGEGIDDAAAAVCSRRRRALPAARADGPLPAGGRSLVHAARRRHRRDRHGAVGRGRVGDSVVVSPSGLSARVRSIHAQNRPAERGKAGDRCALNLAGDGITKEAIRRGDVVLDPVASCADRPHRRQRCVSCRSEPKPIGQWIPGAAPSCRGRGRRAHRAAGRRADRARRRGHGAAGAGQPDRGRCRATASSSATPPRSAPSAAGAFSTCVRRAASAARRSGLPSSKRLRSRRPAKPLVALLRCAAAAIVDLIGFARDRALGAGETERLIDRLGLIQIPVEGNAHRAVPPNAWQRFKLRLDRDAGGFPRRQSRSAGHRDWKGCALQLDPRLPAPAFAAVLQRLVASRRASRSTAPGSGCRP